MTIISVLTIFHLLGVVVGMGGAYSTDTTLFSSVKNGKISPQEFRFIQLGTRTVIIGLSLTILSGIGIVLTNPSFYLTNQEFLAKMTVVVILIINGILVHLHHLPRLKRFSQGELSGTTLKKSRPYMLISGTVSTISWLTALILGATTLPYSLATILTFYILVCAAGVTVSIYGAHKLFPIR